MIHTIEIARVECWVQDVIHTKAIARAERGFQDDLIRLLLTSILNHAIHRVEMKSTIESFIFISNVNTWCYIPPERQHLWAIYMFDWLWSHVLELYIEENVKSTTHHATWKQFTVYIFYKILIGLNAIKRCTRFFRHHNCCLNLQRNLQEYIKAELSSYTIVWLCHDVNLNRWCRS